MVFNFACGLERSHISRITYPIAIALGPEHAGRRLDQVLASQLEGVSRARVQQLISEQKVLVNGGPAKASLTLRGDEVVNVIGEPQRAPLKAMAEEIPLDIVYEDDDLAVINKLAGMMVHAGAGASDNARNRGTLVNALLHHLKNLSSVGGDLRPGIVHRLDKETSGLIVVAKNDDAHRKLSAQFAARQVKKKYMTLVHGWVKKDSGTIDQSISRDRVRRTRMTTRLKGGRSAITHYVVQRRLDTGFGKFSLVDLKIDTGRTHQIRVHMATLGHPVVGDATYGAPRELKAISKSASFRKASEKLREQDRQGRGQTAVLTLPRNFLHSAELEFLHPRTGLIMRFKSGLPQELKRFLQSIEEA
jgi:23S rRNA pseudouridine1911/1915/1917 synthase